MLRLTLRGYLESAEVVNVSSGLIPDQIIFNTRLADIFKEKLNLVAIIDKVTQTTRVVQERQLFQLAG